MAAELRFSRSDPRQPGPVGSVAARSTALARWCVAQGWPVHPLAAGRKTPAGNCGDCRTRIHPPAACPCLRAGRWCHGFHAATTDPDLVSRWWGEHPEFGVGVSCGPVSLVVIDVDAHPAQPPTRDRILPGIPIGAQVDLSGLANGFHTLAVLSALRGRPSPTDDEGTLRVRTPSGGMHVWYRAGDGRRWQSSVGSGKGRALAWQVDVRAHGSYIVAPGNHTRDGAYTPVGDVRTPAALPAWLADELERTGHLQTQKPPVSRSAPPRALQAVLAAGGARRGSEGLLSAVLAPVEACGRTDQGAGFSDALNRAAYTLGGLVAAGRLVRDQAEEALRDVALRVRPGQERRIEQIMRNGFTAGSKRPLHGTGGAR
jgi:uncharacterized protein YndB with AHSA1/START domain